MKQKVIIIASFLILILVTVLPPIIYGYWYPNQSDDTANHLSVILRMVDGSLPDFEFRYFGYAIIGYPMYLISSITHISMVTLFTWFHCLLPLFMGVVLFFVFSRLINWIAGLLALVVPVFLSGASIYYMYYGIVFNLINLTILYPLLFYFVIKWLVSHWIYQLCFIIVLAILVSTFHVSGLYLPIIILFMLVVYLVYSKITHQKICKNKLIIGVVIAAIGVVGILLVPYTRQQIIDVVNGIHGGMMLPTPKSVQMDAVYKSLVSINYFITTFVSVFVLVICGLLVFKYKIIKENITFKSKLFCCILGCWCVVLIIITYLKLSTIPFRQQTDLAIVIAILTTALLGVLVKTDKKSLVVAVILVLVGLYPQFIPVWFENNSAVKEVDKQTIEYLNTLDYETYDCSPTVSYVIYDLFTKSKYKDGSDILIVRSQSMTQGSDTSNVYYDGHGRVSTDGYELNRTFESNGIKIGIFRR